MREIVVDACCLINLLAAREFLFPDPSREPLSEDALPLANPLDARFLVVAEVEAECGYVRAPDPNDPSRDVRIPVDLNPYFQSNRFARSAIVGIRETENLVRFSKTLDAGESASLAIALERGLPFATDDRAARSAAINEGVVVLTTPEILKQWNERTRCDPRTIATILQNIQRFAGFVPRHTSPEADWWERTREGV